MSNFESKICSTCGIKKLLHEFHRDSNRPDGRRSSCKACRSLRNAKDYPIIPELPPPPEEQKDRDHLARAAAVKHVVENNYSEFCMLYEKHASILGVPDSWYSIGIKREKIVTGEIGEKMQKARLCAIKETVQSHYKEFITFYERSKDKIELQHEWHSRLRPDQ